MPRRRRAGPGRGAARRRPGLVAGRRAGRRRARRVGPRRGRTARGDPAHRNRRPVGRPPPTRPPRRGGGRTRTARRRPPDPRAAGRAAHAGAGPSWTAYRRAGPLSPVERGTSPTEFGVDPGPPGPGAARDDPARRATRPPGPGRRTRSRRCRPVSGISPAAPPSSTPSGLAGQPAPETQIMVVRGSAGIGKTALVVQLGARGRRAVPGRRRVPRPARARSGDRADPRRSAGTRARRARRAAGPAAGLRRATDRASTGR